jgi:hypothetical protein
MNEVRLNTGRGKSSFFGFKAREEGRAEKRRTFMTNYKIF